MNGQVIYKGPSLLDGTPIVAIVTGLRSKSVNDKTGNMLQTWILRQDCSPVDAVRDGRDSAICGDCPHRPYTGGKCYVTVFQAPRSVWASWMRGIYPEGIPDTTGRKVRIGSYGDPAAVPRAVWEALVKGSDGWTGYTHQWRQGFALADLCMASVEDAKGGAEAHALGYRAFLAADDAPTSARGIMQCPASAEMGRRLSCESCMACGGTSARARTGIVSIRIH